MVEEPERKCDPDDIVCQMRILSNLKGLQSALGDEAFKSRFPELEGLDEKLTTRISEQDISLKEAMGRCGLLPVEKAGEESTPREE